MAPQCTFEPSFCKEEGNWVDRLEEFYCERHAYAVEALLTEPPLAEIRQSGLRITSPMGELVQNEVAQAISLLDAEYPQTAKLVLAMAASTRLIWLRLDHPFLDRCSSEELEKFRWRQAP